MYTDMVSWIVAFLFLGLFSFFAGFLLARRDNFPGVLGAVTCIFLFCATAIIVVNVVEGTIRSAKNDAEREGVAYRKLEERVENRWLLTAGWYEVVESPIARPIFSEFGDTLEYVSLAIRVDGVGPLTIAFPMESWKLVPPRPEVKWLGERWTLISLPQPQPKAIRLERYEGREYGYEPRVVEARM
ncbi:MAG: hypothetical protein Q7S84_02350 [bacterium]|nr:hypothetical protein [bacterium]